MKKKKYNKKFKVSIIINCYNGENFLKQCIQSVINQTYKNWEIIFWDNLSTDNSKKILKNFKDKRIKYFKTKKFTKLYEARNLAIKKSGGKYISFLDVDDWWMSNKLEKQTDLFLLDPSLDIVYSNCYCINNESKRRKLYITKKLPSGSIAQKLLDSYSIGILTAMVKKNIFEKNKFSNKYDIIGDFDFFVRMSIKNKIKAIQKPLAYYRSHNFNLSKNKNSQHIKELSFWINKNKKNKIFKNFSFKGVYILLQILEIKKNLSEDNKLDAFLKIFSYPYALSKLKFIIFIFLNYKKQSKKMFF